MTVPEPLPHTDAGTTSSPLLAALGGYRRPRLREDVPVLWRTATSIQIGEDVIVDRITRSHVAWLDSLDGLSSPQAVTESLTIPEAEAGRLVRALEAATALEDAARIPAQVRWTPQPARDAVIARHAAALRTYRDPEVALRVTAARDACRVRVLGAGAIAAAADDALAAAGFARDDDHPSVVLLAGSPHPDIPLGLGELPPDLPHLPIGVHGERASVGPLVIPGRTSCLRCAHLHRRDADPAWPVVAVQWAQAMARLAVRPQDPLLVRLALDHALLLLRAWIDLPDDVDPTGVAVDLALPHGSVTRRPCPPHPLCGCLWAAA